jgi:Thioredoxin-like [2Fe-2S] ferredoxin
MYISRLGLFTTATWMITTTETNGTAHGLLQVASPSTTTIHVCQNKACCQRWKLKTPLPDILHDILISNNIHNNSRRIMIETSSCLGQCDKGPNMRINNPVNKENDDVYANGIYDVIGLTAELDERLSITVPSKLLAAVTVFEKAQTGTLP